LKQEIKKRIGQIRDGQAPEGYKKSKVGIVPYEWKEQSFGNLFTFSGGLSIPRDKLTDEGIDYLHYGDIHTREKDYVDIVAEENIMPKIQFDNSLSNCVALDDGDIVFADASEDYEGIGKSVVIYNQENKPAIAGLHTIVAKCKTDDLFRDYKRFFLQTKYIRKQFVFYATGVSVFGVTKNSMGKIIAYLPPLPEQEKIAGILSTWDKAIELKERLIAEKRQQKKWLMQNLLTGQKRLPGFVDEWQKVRLGDLGKLARGKGVSKSNVVETGFPFISYGEIYTNHNIQIKEYRTFINSKGREECFRIYKGDIIFTGSGESAKEIGKAVAFLFDDEAYVGGDTIVLTQKNNNSLFLAYMLNGNHVIKQLASLGQGNSVVHIYPFQLAQISLLIPLLPEQTAIAEILSTADREIDLHERQLEELKKQKKGLMQLLLTGIVRVNTREVF